MNKKRFDQAFAKIIRRGRANNAAIFFQILAEIERERLQKTTELEAWIIEGQLQFAPSPELSVSGNEIFFEDQRIVVHVTSGD